MNKTNSKRIILLSLALAFVIPIVAQMQSSVVVEDVPEAKTEAPSLSQTPQEKIVKSDELKITPELEAKLVALLKTTGKDAAALNMPENRIRYQADTADLLWTRDEKIARDLFASAASDLRGLVQSLDTFYQQRETGEAEEDSFGSMLFGAGHGGSGKFYTTNSIRQNLLLTLAKRDGNAALALFRETQRDNYKEFGWNEAQFETKLGSIIAKNDPARALEIGMQKLSKSNFEGIDDLIVNLYRKDASKGATLAAETVKKLRTVEAPASTYYGADIQTLIFTKTAEIAAQRDESKTDQEPILSDADLRALAEMIIKTRSARAKETGETYYYGSPDPSEYLKKYAPVSYARLERDISIRNNSNSIISNSNVLMGTTRTKIVVNGNANFAMNSNTVSNISDPKVSARESAEQAQSEAFSKLTQAATMSPDAKISLEEARTQLSRIRNRQQKLLALTQIAKAFVARDDKDSARSLLADVAGMQVAQPRKAVEMLQNLMLADAYSNLEPDRAFTIMESTIFEFNSIAAALNRMIDFADVKEIADGEFNMGMIPVEATQSMGSFGLRQPLLNLANADFERTAALADKFEKPELRLEAKVLIARTLLPTEKE